MFAKDQIITCVDNEDIFLLTKGKEYKVLSHDLDLDLVAVICDSGRKGAFISERFVAKENNGHL